MLTLTIRPSTFTGKQLEVPLSADPPIRVMIVDDQPYIRDALRLFVTATPDIYLAAEAGSGEEALNLCTLDQPDVILMDLKMPGMGGIEAVRILHEQFPAVQVVALTSFPTRQISRQVLEAGARDILSKKITPQELEQAIKNAAAGRNMNGC